MARFLLLLSPEHRDAPVLSPAELGRRTADFVRWVAGLRRRGVIRAGARLEPRPRRVTRDRDGTRASGEGAAVGLYFLVEAGDWEEALALAAGCPGTRPGSVDVFALDREASLCEERRT